MQHSKIEWLRDPTTGKSGFSINPVKGLCPMACSYCYARRMYKRLRWNPEIRMEPDWQEELPKKPARVFVGSTMELFGYWVEDWMWDSIWQYINDYPQHTFIFLTKQPHNLIKWSPYPLNVWLGASVTTKEQLRPAIWGLTEVQCNKRFLSFEPLLENVLDQVLPAEWDDAIDWVIIGQQTPVKDVTRPRVTWINEIILAADKASIPVFVKNNIIEDVEYEVILSHHIQKFQRQEVPQ